MAKKKPLLEPQEIGAAVIEAMNGEFHDSSDRVVAVVGAAYLDWTLERLLQAAFIDAPDDVERSFDPRVR